MDDATDFSANGGDTGNQRENWQNTGHGIAGNLRRHYSDWLLYPIVGLLFIANTINIGADLSAMGDALKLLVGGPTTAYAILFGTICALAIVFMDYCDTVGQHDDDVFL